MPYVPGGETIAQQLRLIFICCFNLIRDFPSWVFALSLPRLLLGIPMSRGDGESSAKIVQTRIDLLLGLRIQDLLDQYEVSDSMLRKHKKDQGPDAIINSVNKLVAAGEISKATNRLLSTDKLITNLTEDDMNTITSLLTRNQASIPPVPVTNPTDITPEEIQTAINSLSNSAAGITGFQKQHLTSICESNAGLQALAHVMREITSPDLPLEIQAILNISILVPLRKKPTGIRPVLIGDTLIRVLGRILNKRCAFKLESYLLPFQLAVGEHSGSDAMAHLVRAEFDQGYVITKIDVKNAFGSVARQAISTAIQDAELSEYALFFNRHVKEPSSYLIPDTDMQLIYDEGVPQGGPCSMQLFCLALQQTLTTINTTHKELRAFAYADDIFLISTPNTQALGLTTAEQALAKINLRINHQKCAYISKQAIESDIQRNLTLDVLGTPVGLPSDEKQATPIDDIMLAFQRLDWIENKQARLLLLRCSLGTKYIHLARTIPPDIAASTVAVVDEAVHDCLERIMQPATLTETAWKQATMSINHGGIGLRNLTQSASNDYFSSLTSTVQLFNRVGVPLDSLLHPNSRTEINFTEGLRDARALMAQVHNGRITSTPTDKADPEKLLPKLPQLHLPETIQELPQVPRIRASNALSQARSRIAFRQIWRRMDRHDNHRIQFLANTDATTQLPITVLPTEPGFKLSNVEIETILAQYLCVSVLPVLHLPMNPIRCVCASKFCKDFQKCDDQHPYNCNKAQTALARHRALMANIVEMCRECNTTVRVEVPVNTMPPQGIHQQNLPLKTLDVVIAAVDGVSKEIWIDVSVTSHQTRELQPTAVISPGANARHKVAEKLRKYSKDINPNTDVLLPFVMETSGLMHANIKSLIHHMSIANGDRKPTRANWSCPTFSKYWLQRFSITLWRETSRALQKTALLSRRVHGNSLSDQVEDFEAPQ